MTEVINKIFVFWPVLLGMGDAVTKKPPDKTKLKLMSQTIKDVPASWQFKWIIWRQLLTQTAAFSPSLNVQRIGSSWKFIVATQYGLGTQTSWQERLLPDQEGVSHREQSVQVD